MDILYITMIFRSWINFLKKKSKIDNFMINAYSNEENDSVSMFSSDS